MKDIQFKDLQCGAIFYLYGHCYEKMWNNKCKDHWGSIVLCDPENWVQVQT